MGGQHLPHLNRPSGWHSHGPHGHKGWKLLRRAVASRRLVTRASRPSGLTTSAGLGCEQAACTSGCGLHSLQLSYALLNVVLSLYASPRSINLSAGNSRKVWIAHLTNMISP